nr:DUF4097 domain-containing protein [Mammaliicoccus sp. Marseille-Q6498]
MKKILWLVFSVGLIMFIVFGTLSYFTGKKLADSAHQETLSNETYQDDIKNIKINAEDIDVKIKKGDKFSVKSTGYKNEFKVDSKVENDNLDINVKVQKMIINFNIFENDANKIEVTVPKTLNRLNVKTDTGKILVNELKSKNSTFIVDTGIINIHDSDLGVLEANSDTGKMLFNKTVFKKGNLKTDTGSIRINDTPVDTPLNIKTDVGSVRLVYNQALKNTLFDVKKDVGSAEINRPELKNNMVGSGDNIVKIRSDVGKIQID